MIGARGGGEAIERIVAGAAGPGRRKGMEEDAKVEEATGAQSVGDLDAPAEKAGEVKGSA